MKHESSRDKQLSLRLTRLRDSHEDHWAYRGAGRAHKHALFQYPAMMVADMQRDLAAVLLDHAADATGPVLDPFVGSGTTLGAAMSLGRDFVGWDINPLAVLICKVKAGPLHVAAFADASTRVCATKLVATPLERFDNWRHWFTTDVARGLTSLREAIAAESNVATRRFLWVCLAETVRLTSNSRTSTVKLHRRPVEQLTNRPDPAAVFKRVTDDNLQRVRDAANELTSSGRMVRGWYRGEVSIELGDCRHLAFDGPAASLLITSPPYGDNTSTVTYGQHAYLPLQWIDLFDIDESADPDCLATTHEIDSRSLGGSRRITESQEKALTERSRSLKALLQRLTDSRPNCTSRIVAFTRDLDDALAHVLPLIHQHGLTAWTVGARRVGGQSVPLDKILAELCSARGYGCVSVLHREIPSERKRMASRNEAGSTMNREHVVILRRS